MGRSGPPSGTRRERSRSTSTWEFPVDPVPADGAEAGDATPDLDWADVAGREGYQVQVDDSAAMIAPFLYDDGSLVESEFHVAAQLLNDSWYYWRARVRKNDQWGDWSPTWSFKVVTAPEIHLRQGPTDLPDGTGSRDFGSVFLGSGGSALAFTVENLGTYSLNLTGTPRVAVSGSDAAMFTVGTQPAPVVTPASSTSFSITFNPTSVGPKTATVTIANDDTDENPYTFDLAGSGIAPEINLTQGSTDIPSGSGSHGFGSVLVGPSSITVSFTIENLGTGTSI